MTTVVFDFSYPTEASFVAIGPTFGTICADWHRSPSYELAGMEFVLWFAPENPPGDDCRIYLEVHSPTKLWCSANFEILDKYGHVALSSRSLFSKVCIPPTSGNNWRARTFGRHLLESRQSLLDVGLSVDDACRVKVHVAFCAVGNKDHSSSLGLGRRVVEELAHDLGKLFKSKDGADVVLVTGDIEHKAHRNILAQRSPVFKRMLEAGMTETLTNRVEIADVSPLVMGDFLQFVYSSVLPYSTLGDVQRLGDLMRMADKYEVNSLRCSCYAACCHNVMPDNALGVLNLSDSAALHELKEFTMNFITSDRKRMQTIMESEDFDNLKPSLARELLLFSTGFGKKRASDELSDHEFPDGTDWNRLTTIQLQRACDERRMSRMGTKEEMVLRLESLETET